MKELTLEQAIIISGFTGILMCPFRELQKDIEERMGMPVWTHHLGNEVFMDEVKASYEADFKAMTKHLFKD